MTEDRARELWRGIDCHTSSDSTLLDAETRWLPDLVRASVHY